jgi:hypothetical protein
MNPITATPTMFTRRPTAKLSAGCRRNEARTSAANCGRRTAAASAPPHEQDQRSTSRDSAAKEIQQPFAEADRPRGAEGRHFRAYIDARHGARCNDRRNLDVQLRATQGAATDIGAARSFDVAADDADIAADVGFVAQFGVTAEHGHRTIDAPIDLHVAAHRGQVAAHHAALLDLDASAVDDQAACNAPAIFDSDIAVVDNHVAVESLAICDHQIIVEHLMLGLDNAHPRRVIAGLHRGACRQDSGQRQRSDDQDGEQPSLLCEQRFPNLRHNDSFARVD